MFGPGPSEEINVDAREARLEKPDLRESQARFENQIDRSHETADHDRNPGAWQRLKRWFSARL